MRLIPLALILTVSLSCGKDSSPAYPDHGCVTGVSAARGTRETIGCWHREMYLCGNNQDCADRVAEKYHLKKEDVSRLNSYTDVRFTPNEACDCP